MVHLLLSISDSVQSSLSYSKHFFFRGLTPSFILYLFFESVQFSMYLSFLFCLPFILSLLITMQLWLYDIPHTRFFWLLSTKNIIHKLSIIPKKNRRNKKNENIFNISGRRCRDVKTQNVCKQGREVNVGPKIKQTTSI